MILSCRRPALLLPLFYSILSLSGFLVRLPYPPAPLSPLTFRILCALLPLKGSVSPVAP